MLDDAAEESGRHETALGSGKAGAERIAVALVLESLEVTASDDARSDPGGVNPVMCSAMAPPSLCEGAAARDCLDPRIC